MVEIGFACEYCGEVLATETDERNDVRSDEFHECFGDAPKLIAMIETDRIILGDASIEIVVDP